MCCSLIWAAPRSSPASGRAICFELGPRSRLRRPGVRVSLFLIVAKCIRKTTTSMALHRDIYWVGKQWAVTGHGVQACNQKQKSQFDIAASCLWDDGVQDAVRAEKWVNVD